MERIMQSAETHSLRLYAAPRFTADLAAANWFGVHIGSLCQLNVGHISPVGGEGGRGGAQPQLTGKAESKPHQNKSQP